MRAKGNKKRGAPSQTSQASTNQLIVLSHPYPVDSSEHSPPTPIPKELYKLSEYLSTGLGKSKNLKVEKDAILQCLSLAFLFFNDEKRTRSPLELLLKDEVDISVQDMGREWVEMWLRTYLEHPNKVAPGDNDTKRSHVRKKPTGSTIPEQPQDLFNDAEPQPELDKEKWHPSFTALRNWIDSYDVASCTSLYSPLSFPSVEELDTSPPDESEQAHEVCRQINDVLDHIKSLNSGTSFVLDLSDLFYLLNFISTKCPFSAPTLSPSLLSQAKSELNTLLTSLLQSTLDTLHHKIIDTSFDPILDFLDESEEKMGLEKREREKVEEGEERLTGFEKWWDGWIKETERRQKRRQQSLPGRSAQSGKARKGGKIAAKEEDYGQGEEDATFDKSLVDLLDTAFEDYLQHLLSTHTALTSTFLALLPVHTSTLESLIHLSVSTTKSLVSRLHSLTLDKTTWSTLKTSCDRFVEMTKGTVEHPVHSLKRCQQSSAELMDTRERVMSEHVESLKQQYYSSESTWKGRLGKTKSKGFRRAVNHSQVVYDATRSIIHNLIKEKNDGWYHESTLYSQFILPLLNILLLESHIKRKKIFDGVKDERLKEVKGEWEREVRRGWWWGKWGFSKCVAKAMIELALKNARDSKADGFEQALQTVTGWYKEAFGDDEAKARLITLDSNATDVKDTIKKEAKVGGTSDSPRKKTSREGNGVDRASTTETKQRDSQTSLDQTTTPKAEKSPNNVRNDKQHSSNFKSATTGVDGKKTKASRVTGDEPRATSHRLRSPSEISRSENTSLQDTRSRKESGRRRERSEAASHLSETPKGKQPSPSTGRSKVTGSTESVNNVQEGGWKTVGARNTNDNESGGRATEPSGSKCTSKGNSVEQIAQTTPAAKAALKSEQIRSRSQVSKPVKGGNLPTQRAPKASAPLASSSKEHAKTYLDESGSKEASFRQVVSSRPENSNDETLSAPVEIRKLMSQTDNFPPLQERCSTNDSNHMVSDTSRDSDGRGSFPSRTRHRTISAPASDPNTSGINAARNARSGTSQSSPNAASVTLPAPQVLPQSTIQAEYLYHLKSLRDENDQLRRNFVVLAEWSKNAEVQYKKLESEYQQQGTQMEESRRYGRWLEQRVKTLESQLMRFTGYGVEGQVGAAPGLQIGTKAPQPNGTWSPLRVPE